LLLTLKQLGKEVSEDIHEQVLVAEQKTELFKKTIQKLQKDLNKTLALSEEVNAERKELEDKLDLVQKAKRTEKPQSFFVAPQQDVPALLGQETVKTPKDKIEKKVARIEGSFEGAVGFSAGVVKEIYRMADEEMGINEMVRRTKLSRAEVQLILNLRGNRFTTPN